MESPSTVCTHFHRQPTPRTYDPDMATKKNQDKKRARKNPAVAPAPSTSRLPGQPTPTYAPRFSNIEERLAYVYGSMTPEDCARVLHKAGILTPSGRLSSRFK